MANLIPPDAKRAIITNYWLRVVVVWMMLSVGALAVVLLLQVPAMVLVQSQLAAFSSVYEQASDSSDEFSEAQAVVEDANVLASLLARQATSTSYSEYIRTLDQIAGRAVTISSFQIARSPEDQVSIQIVGQADTRVDLSNFNKSIQARPEFDETNLPLSNLAQDENIAFTITIAVADTSV